MSYSSRPTLSDAIKDHCSIKLGFRPTKRLSDLIEEFVMDGDIEADGWMYGDISTAIRRMLEIFSTAEIFLTEHGSQEGAIVVRIGPDNEEWRREMKHQEVMGNKVTNIKEHINHED